MISTDYEPQEYLIAIQKQNREEAKPSDTARRFEMNDLKSEFMLITPLIAAAMLATMGANRRQNPARIRSFSNLLLAGLFVTTHQGIGFAKKDGRLVDGQHRLEAIVNTGIAAELMVTRGLSEAAVLAIDSGRSRSSLDGLRIRGKIVSQLKLRALKIIAYGPTGFSDANIPVEFLLKRLEPVEDPLDFVLIGVPAKTASEFVAVLTRAKLAGVSDRDIARMKAIVIDKVLPGMSETAMLVLREFYLAHPKYSPMKGKTRADTYRYTYAVTEWMVSKFLKGEPAKEPSTSQTRKELFPVYDMDGVWNPKA